MTRLPPGVPEWRGAIATAVQGAQRPISADDRFIPRDAAGRMNLARYDRATLPPARRSAALLLVYPDATGEPTIPLTRRRHDLRSHPGEVSLPGGALDATDATPEAAALREAGEEIGLDPAGVEVVGRLDEVWIPASNYEIVPVVATAAERPSLLPADAEVAAIVEVPLRALLAGALVDEDEFSVRGTRLQAAFYRYEDERVWGATARILSMLVAVLR